MMPDHRSMADALAEELQTLESEKLRLERLLDLDQNWRELQELDSEAAAGRTSAEREQRAANRERLVAALATNRIYAARQRLAEAIELLSSETAKPDEPASQTTTPSPHRPAPELPPENEVVTLDQPDGSRIKVRVKAKRRAASADKPPRQTTPPPEKGNGADELFGSDDAKVAVTVPGKGAAAAGGDTLMARLRKISEASPPDMEVSKPPEELEPRPGKPVPAQRHQTPPADEVSSSDTASTQPDHAASSRYIGEIEEASVIIIQLDRPRDSKAAKTSPTRPQAKNRSRTTRRAKSSRGKRKPSSGKSADKGKSS
jgi:hypothetical protein